MTQNGIEPCRTCGGPVRTVRRQSDRMVFHEEERRVCDNPNCRTNTSDRRPVDAV